MLSFRRRQIWTLSFVFWTIYAILDSAGSFLVLRAYGDKPELPRVIVWNFAEAYIWVLFTPLIYTLALRYPLSRDTWRRWLAGHVLLGLVTAFASSLVLIEMNTFLGWAQTSLPFRARFLDLAFEILPRYFVTMGVAQIVVYYSVIRGNETESAQLEAELARAQLEVLRSQLEPHFLFNSLNAIARLTRKDAKAAERMTLQLSRFLRASLECTGKQEIPLSRELQFLKDYLAIQATRFGDRLNFTLEVDESLLDVLVPSLLLQPIVENAIKHGIAHSLGPGFVSVRVSAESGYLRIEIVNSGTQMREYSDNGGAGIGLRNTRARLRQLYGEEQDLRVAVSPGGGCIARLQLPLTRELCSPSACS